MTQETTAANESQTSPTVSVVMPVRNEADFIERAVRSVLDNDYPSDRLEVLVVDGMSDDGTRQVVEQIARADGRLRLLDNPDRIVPHAMNAGIRAARGEIVTRVDGHAAVAADFIRRGVQALQDHPEAWCAGGPVETLSSSYVGRAIAAAMCSRVGAGNAMYRLGHYEGHVDTILYGSYWRWVFDRIGLFDEELVRNQDDELNLRLILAGGKIYMTPAIRSQYFARDSLRKLARQYFQYGFWRIRTIQKHRRPATLRQVAPLVFVCTWIALAAGVLLWRPIGWGLAGLAGLYALALLAGAIDVGRKAGWKCALLAPLVFAILHFAYGLGGLGGIWAFWVLRKGGKIDVRGHPMSR